jgi:ribonuclease HI
VSHKLKIEIFTDGACSGNPGPGGYGILLKCQGYPTKELSKGFQHTTNNRMELLAVIDALKALKRSDGDVTVYTDSSYVVNSITKGWVFNWAKKGFSGKKNPDLWKEYLPLHKKFNPTLIWIKGHNDHPENERCDRLAVEASKSASLHSDYGFNESASGLFD